MTLLGRAYRYLRSQGIDATVRGLGDAIKHVNAPVEAPDPSSPEMVIRQRFPALSRLPLRRVPGSCARINLVTDTINPPHLFGGVATALIFATLLAERTKSALRIITGVHHPDGRNFDHVLRMAGIDLPHRLELAFAPYGAPQEMVETCGDELFVTSSWWSTRSTLGAIEPGRVLYLLQEDERLFYPLGDDHLRCAETLANREIRFLINSRLLFDHLIGSGLDNIAERGLWFEPSFPATTFHSREPICDGPPYRFLFYARPNNVRNLFYRGLEAVDRAIVSDLLGADQWELHFVGKDIPHIQFRNGVRPFVYENLLWESYAALVRRMDLGLCLMYTPHPSYPPFDLAASGGVVVTNRFAGKVDLGGYSKNILCVGSGLDELVQGIAQGVALAKHPTARRANFEASRISRDWRAAFSEPLTTLASQLF